MKERYSPLAPRDTLFCKSESSKSTIKPRVEWVERVTNAIVTITKNPSPINRLKGEKGDNILSIANGRAFALNGFCVLIEGVEVLGYKGG